MLQSDFDFILQLFNDFFSQQHISQRLAFIEEHEITGWEIWLQIEFSVFVEAHDDVDEWFREERYAFDKRKVRNKNFMLVDFILRKKHAVLERFIALELKQNLNIYECISEMFSDLEKVNAMKESKDDIRSFWNIGIHPTIETSYVEERIIIHLKDCSIELSKKRIKTIKINNTAYSFTIF